MSAATPDPQPPPPAPPPPADDGKASGGLRALAAVIALVLAFAAAVMIFVAVDIGETSTCDQFFGDVASGEITPDPDDECFDGSSAQKTISVVLAWASGVAGVLAVLAALALAITGRRGRLLAQLAGAAIALGGLSILIGSI